MAKKDEEIVENEAAIEEQSSEATEATEANESSQSSEEVEEADEKTTAKAGKRSAKAQREAEELAAKEERKAKREAGELKEDDEKKKGEAPKTRPLIERRGKAYRKAHEKITEDAYPLIDACKLASDTSTVKFDATVEMHIRLNVDPRQADQNIRDSLVLPNGTGKEVRVAVFAPENQHEAAKKAGADIVGEDSILEDLKKEIINFDVLIATPSLMAKLGRFAKVLGPKGLMPNPKSGTVTQDVVTAVKEAKAGRIEFRVDSNGIVHVGIGKVSFGAEKVHENAEALLNAVIASKPSSIKGAYVESIYLSTSMGPSIPVAQ